MILKSNQATEQNKKTIKNYLPTFTGRVTRKQYLAGFGILCLSSFVIVLLQELHPLTEILAFPLCIEFALILFSLHVRRLHDLNQSGWVVIGYFIPFVNFILAIYVLFWPGKDEKNKYGDRLPKDAGAINCLLGK